MVVAGALAALQARQREPHTAASAEARKMVHRVHAAVRASERATARPVQAVQSSPCPHALGRAEAGTPRQTMLAGTP